jgi:hypothetical protein
VVVGVNWCQTPKQFQQANSTMTSRSLWGWAASPRPLFTLNATGGRFLDNLFQKTSLWRWGRASIAFMPRGAGFLTIFFKKPLYGVGAVLQ